MEGAAASTGDPVVQMHVSLASVEFRGWREPRGWAEWRPIAEHALDVFGPAGDHLGLARAWYLISWDGTARCRYAESIHAARQGLEHAVVAGDRRLELELLSIHIGDVWGPLPVEQGLAMCEDTITRALGNRALEADARATQGALIAMRGEFDRARELYAQGKAIIDELGRPVTSAFAVQAGWYIEMLARDFGRAEELTRTEYGRLMDADALALQSITGDMLALALCAQGRFEEADEFAGRSERSGHHPDDITAQNVWRRVRARSLSAHGEHEEALRLAHEAEALFHGTDALTDHGEALLDLAGVLRAAGQVEDAATAAAEALALYEQKENVVEAARARRFRDELPR